MKFAAALGAEGGVLSRTPEKAADARKLGAVDLLVTTDTKRTGRARGRFDTISAPHDITADVEVLPSSQVQEALDRLARGDVRYRFVLDLSDLDQGCWKAGACDVLCGSMPLRSQIRRPIVTEVAREWAKAAVLADPRDGRARQDSAVTRREQ
ncbi:hypothetical protein [Umezawaea sp. Da 62-37]|uniref:hypothetical protein n=1 Tax=Umezawaea sp. Da 62-37 TaxID=3075927 RepID=UPI0028F6D550|nr:hypothetical protein [Umezawaea sp. Da 62-37]WNV84643.1 hypothetical protein RM788_41835 [Umezawaea sp. Da 62-37]